MSRRISPILIVVGFLATVVALIVLLTWYDVPKNTIGETVGGLFLLGLVFFLARFVNFLTNLAKVNQWAAQERERQLAETDRKRIATDKRDKFYRQIEAERARARAVKETAERALAPPPDPRPGSSEPSYVTDRGPSDSTPGDSYPEAAGRELEGRPDPYRFWQMRND